MQKIHRESFIVRTCDCDMSGQFHVGKLLTFLLEGAGTHAQMLRCGRDLLVKSNIVWVLARTELHMERYPTAGENIQMETFPLLNRRWFFPRHFLIFDEKRQILGRAVMVFLLMDLTTRSMASPESVLHLLPDNSDLEPALPFPDNVPPVDAQELLAQRAPVYSEIDVNQHLNSSHYADWLCDTLGTEEMQQKEIARLLIHYQKEIRPNQPIQLSLQQNGDQVRLRGLHEGAKHFDIGATLRNR